MSYIILSIHGLANKPPADVLEQSCKKVLVEGLKRNCNLDHDIHFKGIYWADVMYPSPLSPDDEPYVPAPGTGPFKTYKDGWLSDVVAGVLGAGGSAIDGVKRYFGMDALAEKAINAKLQDLDQYYENAEKRGALRSRLRDALLEHGADSRIMLIAHSMGSIIAYDLLRAIGRENPDFKLDHFVTIGSPLGLPQVKHKVFQENPLVRTPTVVRRWTNLADRRDPVAVDVHLRDDYEPNDAEVQVKDDLVINNYIGPSGKANPHKIYGYLRCPEMSQLVRAFL